MIKIKNIAMDDVTLDFLAEGYLKLKQNKTYQSFQKTFKQYIDEFLCKELLAIQKNKEKKDG